MLVVLIFGVMIGAVSGFALARAYFKMSQENAAITLFGTIIVGMLIRLGLTGLQDLLYCISWMSGVSVIFFGSFLLRARISNR